MKTSHHPGLPPLPPSLKGKGKAAARMRFYNHWFEEHLLPPLYKPGDIALAQISDALETSLPADDNS